MITIELVNPINTMTAKMMSLHARGFGPEMYHDECDLARFAHLTRPRRPLELIPSTTLVDVATALIAHDLCAAQLEDLDVHITYASRDCD